MKQMYNNTKKLIKGTPTAVLVSIALHAILLIGAASWIVVQIEKKKADVFVPPPPIERQPIPIKKPTVKKDRTPPKKESTRISSKSMVSQTEISLPAISGTGGGLGNVGSFQMVADLQQMSLFGGEHSVGNDLVGTFYDIKRDRNGGEIKEMDPRTTSSDAFDRVLGKFLANNWSTAVLDPFFRSAVKLYATQMMVVPVQSTEAPEKFGVSRNIEAARWIAIYRGKIVYTNDITFRFVGRGDDFMFVRFGGKVVLNASHGDDNAIVRSFENCQSSSVDNRKWKCGPGRMRVGDWVTLKANEPKELEILIAESPGGIFMAMLMVQVQGVDYPKSERGNPILPMFRTAPTPQHLIDEINYGIYPGVVDVTNGPIFNVY